MIVAGILLIVMVFGVVGYFILSGTRLDRTQRSFVDRMKRPKVVGDGEILREGIKKTERWLGYGFGWVYKLDLLRKVEQSLWQAGIYRRVSDVLLVMLLLFGAGAVIGAAIWQDVLFSLAMGAGLAALPMFYVRIRRARRLKKFAMQLPFALDLMK